MVKTLDIVSVLKEGTALGIKNAASIVIAVVLYILTIWIPYLNVGTTIAIQSLPLALSRGEVISPFFIFDGKYRKYMGEYFSLIGLQAISLIPAYLFLFIPGIIISIGWSLSLYLMIDKGLSPSEAMMRSTKCTYGNKLMIFLIGLLLFVAIWICAMILFGILGAIDVDFLTVVFGIAFIACACVVPFAVNAIIYRELSKDVAEQE